jgi:hypothetical protein
MLRIGVLDAKNGGRRPPVPSPSRGGWEPPRGTRVGNFRHLPNCNSLFAHNRAPRLRVDGFTCDAAVATSTIGRIHRRPCRGPPTPCRAASGERWPRGMPAMIQLPGLGDAGRPSRFLEKNRRCADRESRTADPETFAMVDGPMPRNRREAGAPERWPHSDALPGDDGWRVSAPAPPRRRTRPNLAR